MAHGRIIALDQDDSGRNTTFKDTRTGEVFGRNEFVGRIERGQYPNYHVREINGVKTPVSNPDGGKDNNLG